MPKRKTPLISSQIYHIFNRSVAQLPIFRSKREFGIFTNLIEYYRFESPQLRFSHYSRLNKERKNNTLIYLYAKNQCKVNIYAFCIMANHYHLLVQQKSENGISDFIRLIQNSYAHYINIKSKRFGSLFQSPFKGIRIETDEQFMHVARYIHLNPITSYTLKNIEELDSYEWNSFADYTGSRNRRFIDKLYLLSFYKDYKQFRTFTYDNVDYQRHLEYIKHLTID